MCAHATCARRRHALFKMDSCNLIGLVFYASEWVSVCDASKRKRFTKILVQRTLKPFEGDYLQK